MFQEKSGFPYGDGGGASASYMISPEEQARRSGTQRAVIEVNISNVEVDEDYYDFDYEINVYCGKKIEGHINNDHAWADPQRFRKYLLGGYAVELALEMEATNLFDQAPTPDCYKGYKKGDEE